ncbi:Gfo/Idh/MocA family protein [Anaeromassilibacillus senegalensis]|uniref:Gfo/Idh/MocA family oxidoreductase n=1 Tax=Anaeromassilibacillus senegalensis TaxID=1673717 RepID=A0ABS9CNF8_9FIRM|nr:Gfo/Idh/MocA family oxidoreductase [Anaeromassilibacillus senegalensis]MCF2652315.1 Gfo/Idh/MocA family oxidoreductase [Anaeromassilibacillus senegalensis]
MNHGFNVLVEKPFARTAAEVDTMIETAAKNKVMLAVFQQSRFAPYYRQVRKVLDSGVLGRLIQVSIQFDSYGRR